MPELRVDAGTCTRCGLCGRVCPRRVIGQEEGKLPRYRPGGEERCMICGHCEAVCPPGALELLDPRLEEASFPFVPGEAEIAPERLGAYLRMRRSVRAYLDREVPRETIAALLDTVRYAPTGSNSQQVAWLVIHDPAEVRRLAGLVMDWLQSPAAGESPLAKYLDIPGMMDQWRKGRDPVCRKAPHLLVAHAHREAVTARTDAIIALAHLEIAAPAFGLGTCWAGLFQIAATFWPPLRSALALPPGHQPVFAMMLGYPAIRFRRVPKRNPLRIDWR